MLKIKTQPAEEPVSVAELRLQVRITDTAEDAILTEKGITARQRIEDACNRAFCTQTWYLYADGFPRGIRPLLLQRPPIQGVTAITYVDNNGVTQTLDASQYKVDAASEPGRIMPAFGLCWPIARREINAVRVEFVAGYGAAADVPAIAKAAIKLYAGYLYEHREAGADLPTSLDDLLRLLSWGSYVTEPPRSEPWSGQDSCGS